MYDIHVEADIMLSVSSVESSSGGGSAVGVGYAKV